VNVSDRRVTAIDMALSRTRLIESFARLASVRDPASVSQVLGPREAIFAFSPPMFAFLPRRPKRCKVNLTQPFYIGAIHGGMMRSMQTASLVPAVTRFAHHGFKENRLI